MPRTLNIEKLEKKFVSLTRSRESIQGLSSWIMHHKEFYQEIVEEWLNALKKEDFNALNMFYVANDVIQHCGKKKAPEYRTAFSTVLERALSLAKVKEIRSEVTRMLTLWHDKEIYDDTFFKHLENTLNNEPPASEIGDEEKELSDSEIISTFKLQNLVEASENLKRIIDEVNCKEAKVRNLKCPETFNVEDLIVRMDKKDTYKQYKKADAYCKYVDDLIASFVLLNDARADVVKYLKYTTVFYTAQNEEVKKVVQAYRIYGKKLKIMEKNLTEKMSVLHELFPSPVPESPMSGQSFELSPPLDSPTVNLNQELVNAVDSNQNSPSSNNEYAEDTGHGIYVPTESPSEDVENAESMHQKNANFSKATIAKDSQTVEVTAVDAPLKSKQEEVTAVEAPLKLKQEEVTAVEAPLKLKQEEVTAVDAPLESKQEDSCISEAKSEVESNIKDSEITEKNNAANAAEDIDFLLEKAYDERQVKKANIKRKIETLLKAKGSKTCKVSDSEKDEQNGSNESKLPTKAAMAIMKDSNDGNHFNNPATETVGNKEKLQTPPYQDADKISENDTFQSDITTDTRKENQDQDVPMTDESSSQSKTSKEDTDASDKNSVPKMCVYTPQSLSDIPLELLKSILDKNILNTVSSQENIQKEEDNDESSERVSFSHDTACSVTNEKPKDFSAPELKPDRSIMQTESSPNVLAESVASSEELTKVKEENQLLNEITDKESAINEMKLCDSKTENMDTENMDTEKPLDNEQYNVSKTDVLDNAKSSSFLETLDTTLKCLTANNLSLPNFKGTEKQMPQNTFSDATFESSLRIYNFLLQCHQAIGSKGNHTDNLVSDRSEINNTVPDSGNVHVNSSVASQNALDNNESSKHDNLELMDMDVDSEDDS